MTQTTDHLESITDGARSLVAAAVHWITHETATASLALAIAAGLFVGLSALRRLVAPRSAQGHAPAALSLGAVARRVLSHTKDWFLLGFAAQLTAAWFALPDLLARGVTLYATVALTWQLALWVRGLILALIQRRAAAGGADSGLANALDIVRVLVTALIFAIAGIAILDNLGANVTGLIAGLGIGGIAIGLAAQGVVGDLFAALSIIFDRPFARGDSINFEGVDGRVEAIGLKTTRIRALSGEEVVIGNANLLGKVIRNYARQDRRRISLKLGLIYQTPPDQAEALPALLREIVESVEHCVFVRAGLTGFGDSSIDYSCVFDVMGESFEAMIVARHQVIATIFRRFAELKLEFAYPSQTQFLAAPDGTIIDPRDAKVM